MTLSAARVACRRRCPRGPAAADSKRIVRPALNLGRCCTTPSGSPRQHPTPDRIRPSRRESSTRSSGIPPVGAGGAGRATAAGRPAMRWSPFNSAVAAALVLGAASAAPGATAAGTSRAVPTGRPSGSSRIRWRPACSCGSGQDGLVRVVAPGACCAKTPFLDLRGVINSGGERGLLGLAFPPDAAASGRVFVNFTNPEGHTVIARFTRRGDDPHAVDPGCRGVDFCGRTAARSSSSRSQSQRRPPGVRPRRLPLHRPGRRRHRATIPATAPRILMTLLGKMLRLDVYVPDDDPRGYVVPPAIRSSRPQPTR